MECALPQGRLPPNREIKLSAIPRAILQFILVRCRLTVLIAALTGGAVVVTSAALLAVIFVKVESDIGERYIQGQIQAVRIGATLLKRAYPQTEISWTGAGQVEKVAVDRFPSFSDHSLVDTITLITGDPASFFAYDPVADDFVRLSTTIKKPDGSRAVGTVLGKDSVAYSPLKRGEAYSGRAEILGVPYYTNYQPVFDRGGEVIGIIFAGVKEESVVKSEQILIWSILVISGILISIMSGISLLAARWFLRPVPVLADAMNTIAKSDLGHAIPYTHWKNEIGSMARALVAFRDQALEKVRLEKEAESFEQIEASRRALELKNAELDQAADQLEVALNNMGRGLSMFDAEGRLVVCNNAYRDIYKLPDHVTCAGTPFSDIVYHHAAIALDDPLQIEKTKQWLAEHEDRLVRGLSFARAHRLDDGKVIDVSVMPLAKGGWVGIHEDITIRLQQDAKLSHMASHDPLTDLANRRSLHEHLEKLLLEPNDRPFAVHFLDLDNFKDINDTFGHAAGDQLLKQVSERLKSCVRNGDFIARLGGDEFAIVQGGIDCADDALDLANGVLSAVSDPIELDGHHAMTGTSIGIALAPRDGRDLTTLLKHADLALYRSKKDGLCKLSFYDPAMSEEARARHVLEQDLRSALAARQFELFYQPQMNSQTRELRGFEALIRWNHPKRMTVTPTEFIPLAEETGLIVPIGNWVLREACFQAQSWPRHLSIAVNVSALQLKHPNFFDAVVVALADSRLPPHRLEIEITEGVFVESSGAALETLRKLHAHGVRLSLDDFGTGYSSLNYLRVFPIDKIKIDRSFVKEALENANALAIIRAVAHLGRSLGLSVCAEGVETEAQLAQVRDEGCTEIQGYIMGRAEPAIMIEKRYFSHSGSRQVDAA